MLGHPLDRHPLNDEFEDDFWLDVALPLRATRNPRFSELSSDALACVPGARTNMALLILREHDHDPHS